MRIGVDIGGTKISGVVLAPAADRPAVRVTRWHRHDARDFADVTQLIVGMVEALRADPDAVGDAVAIGVSAAGLVDENGLVTRRGIPAMEAADLAGAVARVIDVRPHVMNDADATLLAVVAAEGVAAPRDAVLLTLGTGVGGATLRDGRVVHGRRGFAGELGHLPVLGPLPYRCVCGGTGCLEQYASGRGLAERAAALAAIDDGRELLAAAGVTAAEITSVHVADAAAAGVGSAQALLDDAAAAIAQAVIAVSVVVEPARVYLGGTLGHALGPRLLPRITQVLGERWPFATAWPPPALAFDGVGPYAAAIGAAISASHSTHPANPDR